MSFAYFCRMMTSFPIDILYYHGSKSFVGDIAFSCHMKLVHLIWTRNGLLMADDSAEIIIETEVDSMLVSPGCLISWEKLPGQWSVYFPQSDRIASGKVLHFESIQRLFDYSEYLNTQQMIEGLKHLLMKQCQEGDLSWHGIQEVYRLSKQCLSLKKDDIEIVLAPYKLSEALRTMISWNPPRDAVTYLKSVFKP